jgi:hypothetical protein
MTTHVTEAHFEAAATAAVTLFETGHFGAALLMDDLAREMNNALSGYDESQSPLEVSGKRQECEDLAREVDAKA